MRPSELCGLLAALLLVGPAAAGDARPSGRAAALQAIRAEEAGRSRDSAVLRREALSRDAAVRAAALRAMGRIQSPSYLRQLSAGLYDRAPEVRAEAVFGLGQTALSDGLSATEREKAASLLAGMLRRASQALRPAVAAALGKTGGRTAERNLTGLLSSPDPAVRGEACLALFRLKFLKRLPEHSDAAVAALTEAFSDRDPGVRWRAVYVFSRWPEPRAAEGLAVAAGDEDLWTRFFAVRALGQLGPAAPVEVLVKALGDADPLVRTEAVKALAGAAKPELIEPRLFTDESAHVRAAACEAVGASGRPELASRLAPLLSEGSVLVRAAALEALAKVMKDGAVTVLLKERTHPHWWVRSRAYLSLAGLQGGGAALKEGLKDPDPRIAAAALEAVSRSTDSFSDADLASVITDPGSQLEVLGTAVDAAGRRKSPSLVGPLEASLKSPTALEFDELRQQIVETLEAIDRAHPEGRRLPVDGKAAARPRQAPLFAAPAGPVVVVLETDKGEIEITLAGAQAPAHAASFAALASSGAYDGTSWHRVVSGFVVQGGDPRGSGWGDAGYTLPDEINPLPFDRGSVGMPNAGKDTGGSQLFITHVPAPHLDGRYTVFGRVTRGMEVVDGIEPGDRIVRAFVKAP
ncbi:MAG: HEAT repeat domain-containing protein [Elusimicrobia bacterium]|nr:HEAT repeat domain-containing protein [Elusimicrobiota bacterium]